MREIQIIGGEGARIIDCGQVLHRVPNEIATAGLTHQLDSLFKSWFCCLMFTGGNGTLRGDGRKAPKPSREASERLVDLCVRVNRDLHHDGHWVGVWASSRIALLWRDGDGDSQFTIDFDEPWSRVRDWTVNEMAERAEGAHKEWLNRMRIVEQSRDATIKQAQGERSRAVNPSDRVH